MLQQIRVLAHNLRYRQMSVLIDQVVTINSIETVEANIFYALAGAFPSDSHFLEPEAKYMLGSMGKYGILDLEFQVPDGLLEAEYESGIALLRKLHFLRRKDQLQELTDIFDDLSKPTGDPTCLTELCKEMDRGQTILKLFLETERIQGVGPHMIGRLPLNYLPREFVIKDACITNSGYVWFHKHFYL